MPDTFDALEPCVALIAIARDFHARGWMAGTSGNLSVRHDADSFWITASGGPKGRLNDGDFVRVAIADCAELERIDPQAKLSAESSIHCAVYQLFATARACLHVHTVDATRVSLRAPATATSLTLPPIEMLKGLDIWELHPQVELALFENLLEVPRIAEAIRQRFGAQPPRVPALLIRGHGVTVWGENLQQAYNRVEVVEFLLSYLART